MIARRAVATAATAALLMTACGGSDDDASGANVEAAGAEASDPADDADDNDSGSESGAGLGALVPGDDATGKPAVQLPDELSDELVVTDLLEGDADGPAIEAGDTATVHYVGILTETGEEFDNSWDRGQPFPVTLGIGQVIPGWDEGLLGAQIGTRRQLEIPPSLGYGEAGAGGVIPPNAYLTFVVDVLDIDKVPQLTEQADPSECPATDGSSEQQTEFDEYPPTCIDVTKTYTAEIETNFGPIVAELDPSIAPLTVNSFVVLARYHYFDDTECHRAIPDFVVQCGDPTATGTGGPGYRFPDELPGPSEYQIGSLAMANSGPDTNGSQFFIITGDNGAALPPQYSLFGEVVEGLETTVADLNAVANPDDNGVPPLEEIIIESVTIVENP